MSPKSEINAVMRFAAVNWLDIGMKKDFSSERISSKVLAKNKTSNFEFSGAQIRTDKVKSYPRWIN